MPERLGDKPQLPSHSSVKAIAKKFTLDACLDGSVSQVRLDITPLLAVCTLLVAKWLSGVRAMYSLAT